MRLARGRMSPMLGRSPGFLEDPLITEYIGRALGEILGEVEIAQRELHN